MTTPVAAVPMPQVATSSIRFHGLIAPEEPEYTGDQRIFARAALSHRRLPAPVMFTRELGSRHQGAVAVGRLEGVEYVPGQGWVGTGSFLDPRIVPEVAEAVYLVQQGVSRPSVDLEPDLTFEVVDAPHQPGEIMRRILRARIMGFTFVPYSAFDQVRIEVTDQADADALLAAGVVLDYEDGTFAVNASSWRSMPIAARETQFKFREAINRLLEWSRGQPSTFSRAFLYRDPRGDPGSRESYRLPIADIVDGKLTLIPRAVFSAATFLSGGHGGLKGAQIQPAELERIRTVVTRIYEELRKQFNDPRIRPPWQRGGRQGADSAATINPEGEGMPTYKYTVDTDTGEVIGEEPSTFQDDGGSGDCGNIDVPDAGNLDKAARECAARRGWAMEGGKYPIRSKEMHGASDLSKAIKAVGRGGGSHDEIRQHVMKRARSLGLADQIPENWTSSGSKGGDDSAGSEPTTFQDSGNGNSDGEKECPEGKHWDSDEEKCVADEESDSDSGDSRKGTKSKPKPNPSTSRSDRDYQVVTAAGSPSPPAELFQKRNLTRATPLTVDEDGSVYGHLATWNECHTGIGNRCVTAPRSATDYAYFRTGEVVCADGSRVSVGKITLGTGHADPALGMIPATEHYDNTGAVVSVVVPYEDRFGIQLAGGLVAGVDEQRLAELRRSPLSGDWRRKNGNLELVAALAVNSPGFPVLRASAGEGDEEILETLLAAGAISALGPVDPEEERAQRWRQVENMVRARRAKELLGA